MTYLIGAYAELYLFHVLGVMAAITLSSYLAGLRDPEATAKIRLWWNWLLLAAFLVCMVTGLALAIPLEPLVRGPVYRLHIWAGACTAWAGIYHTIQRARALLPQ